MASVEDAPTLGPRAWRGVLFPVFVTASIPIETINDCLRLSAEYLIGWDLEELIGLALITDAEGSKPRTPSYPPVVSNSSSSTNLFSPLPEYLGRSATELRSIYLARWANNNNNNNGNNGGPDADLMSGSSFIVLDEQTARDGTTCLLVSVEADGGVTTARSDFALMCKVIDGPEQGEETLGEGYEDHQEEDIGGGGGGDDEEEGDASSIVVFRRAWFDLLFASSGMGTIDFDDNGFREDHPNFRAGE